MYFFYSLKKQFGTNGTPAETKSFAVKSQLKIAGKEVEKIVGYYTQFQNALRVVAREKFYKNKGEFETITEYIDAWDEVKTGMELLLKKVEI